LGKITDQLLTNVITQLPNFAVALVMLWWQKQTIDQLLDNQTKLIDRLLTYVDNDKQAVQRVIDASTPTTSRN
jgi:hypothetical protein